ncbi:MAG: type II and III secretion system protein [Gammaproteobacteria bacterium]|jgi:type II secretory pathway component HofQ|nr:type II and III secretion system protein [Gammaproteobacteria bacterium]MBU1468308.1 type II and III secretion system protein [Gammaproteobacteria bacterium]MBU2021466.1 type II and III secretion system protein [Gammaproteobacteria bacterium]MBU2239245.1 type II and III secretion system protein [Gammaproteobacteria bacterium]MBU2320126.1 type II and III secretion system protein [Gammaproteobacteria bacterium]
MNKLRLQWLLVFFLMMPRTLLAMDVYFESRSLQEVLPWLASQMNESVVISPEIDDVLTLSIKDASWKDVMEAIAQPPHIQLEWQGRVAVLMPVKTPLAESIERTSVVCQRSYWVLKHAKAKDVGVHLRTLHPSISLVVDDRTNSIIAHSCASLEGVQETLDWLDTPLKQIEISAQIAQVSRTAQSQFGVNWQAKLSDGVRSSIGGAVDLGALTPTTNLDFSSIGGSSLLALTLDMMESEGLANVVSKPKIVTSEGLPARIESGTEVPYQTVSDDKVSIEFRQAALMLEVTPFVKDGGHILLSLTIHQDSVGDLVNGVPSLKTNRLKTQVVVKNQETLVLGGVFREERFESESRVPFFSDIPWLGELFKRQSEQQEKVELLVFITPKLLQMSVN